MKSSATLMVISGDKQITQFMQCADVFEKSKVIGTLKTITVSYKKNEIASLKRAALLINATKQALEQENEIVSFIHVVEVTNGNTTIRNQGEIIPYINKEVRCVSSGNHWFVLAKFIENKTNLKVITNEHMFVTGVGIDGGLSEVKIKIKKH